MAAFVIRVDASAKRPIGSPSLVSQCPEDDPRIVRFEGDARPAPGAVVMLGCRAE